MFRSVLLASVPLFALTATASAAEPSSSAPAATHAASEKDSISNGTVTVNGAPIHYQAVAGTLLVHNAKFDDSKDVIASRTGKTLEGDKKGDDGDGAVASIFYVAYFKQGAHAPNRPITFLYNGGPGSASVWLHMGSVGPLRLNTPGDQHLPPAPYKLINNAQSLLDVTDLVFIDAPGTGFSRIAGKDAEKAFYGVDADGKAFTHFISQFLAKYGRFNSPKYLFGESYGTLRSAVVANDLENDESIDFNGIILLSQILNYDNDVDNPQANPGNDDPYQLALPTYAATSYYHKALPQMPTDLPAFLREVEHFALTDYAQALAQGADLPEDQRKAIAEKLHDYTGLPVDYILRDNLRISGGQYSQQLLASRGITVGRLDTRYSGPPMDPMTDQSDYDPQSSAISSAYISAFNDYVRNTLHYGEGQTYRAGVNAKWDSHHRQPFMGRSDRTANVMPDLAVAMKNNPTLRVMLNAGYYDLATPYFEGLYEMKHLPIPADLQKNIEYKQYTSGHMVYVDPASLQKLHDNVADFIRRTDNQ